MRSGSLGLFFILLLNNGTLQKRNLGLADIIYFCDIDKVKQEQWYDIPNYEEHYD
jgi:hypothetical protein